ncbi:lactonase family protein [Lacunimicrobium album]
MTYPLPSQSLFRLAVCALSYFANLTASSQADDGRYLYIQANDIREGQNAVLGYVRHDNGTLSPLPGNPYYTAGTGVNNDTHGKLGPHDNDTPLVVSQNGKYLFSVNTHSNTIAAFAIHDDGSLKHVKGSPFSSHGVAPNSLSVSGNALLVSNRNEDYHQIEELRGKAKASYVSFVIEEDGSLQKVSKIDVEGAQKPTQIHISQTDPAIAFGCDFQVDVDFDSDKNRSFLAGPKPSVQGQLHVFQVGHGSLLTEKGRLQLPETNVGYKYKGMDGVPSMPLGLWTHPKQPLLYVGFVTRNEVGVYSFNTEGEMHFKESVSNSGQDICWVLPNKEGTRLYTINNLPRPELGQKAATVSTYDISGEHAEKPVEIGVLELPMPGESFKNNRNFEQPGSTAFQCNLNPEETILYVMCQRINQTDENKSEEGNILHSLKIDQNGVPSISHSRHLGPDGIDFRSRPQGIVTINK